MKRQVVISCRQLKISGRELNYTLRQNRTGRALRLTIHGDGSLVVTQPRRVPFWAVEKYLTEKANWIFSQIDHFGQFKIRPKPFLREKYLLHKEPARTLIAEKLARYNQFYNFAINNIAIKDQKTRWGSCSRKGNLNFNYKIIFLPPDLADLIVVHELCHLQEFNHSPRFWALVEKTIPDYRRLKGDLRKIKAMTLA
jgi:hypothetical protein